MGHQIEPILLVSLTARMLAELAVRAGYTVLALDYFGDTDLQALCPSRSLLRDYGQAYSPTALVDVAGELQARSVIYGASLENHPAEVTRLAQGRRLLGNTPEVLKQVRNPIRLATTLRAGGFAFPETFKPEPDLKLDSGRRWLWKPLRSGGGHSIRPWRDGRQPDGGVLQEQLTGTVGSAAFVADGQEAVLLGLTEQLVGWQAFAASGFRYCGNLIPPRLSADELNTLLLESQSLVTYLTKTFGLRGLNGLDFVWHRGRVWTLEINPRPSASLELIDTLYDIRVLDAHIRSFDGYLPQFDLAQVLLNGSAAGKAILYAAQDVTIGFTSDWTTRGIRDVPHPGERIEPQHPICTLLTTDATPAACLEQLQKKATEVKNWLEPTNV